MSAGESGPPTDTKATAPVEFRERTPARQQLAQRIAAVEPTRQHERALRDALERAGEIQREAQAALDAHLEALQASGQSLAKQLVHAARTPDGESVAWPADPEGARAEIEARSKLAAARLAGEEIGAELEAAQDAQAAAQVDLESGTQGVLLELAGALVAEGMRLSEQLDAIREQVWSIEKIGGLSRPDQPWRPFPLSEPARLLLFGFKPSERRSLDATVESWRRFREALRDDPDAAPPVTRS